MVLQGEKTENVYMYLEVDKMMWELHGRISVICWNACTWTTMPLLGNKNYMGNMTCTTKISWNPLEMGPLPAVIHPAGDRSSEFSAGDPANAVFMRLYRNFKTFPPTCQSSDHQPHRASFLLMSSTLSLL